MVTTTSIGARRLWPRIWVALAALSWLLAAAGTRAAGPEVVLLPTTGIVDDGMAKYLADGIGGAAADGAAAVVIKLNTPGGSLFSTNDIDSTILESKVPVIVWVAPAGGFAASAGTFITLSSNIALMAPGTRIGAASPVGGGGEDITGTEGQKVLNDAIANISSIARLRHRNVDWAVSAVRDAKSSPSDEAVAMGVVDGLATTIDDVIAFANGKTVQVGGQPVVLNLTGATVTERDMSPLLGFLRLLSDPTLAALLFTAGSAGIIAELWSPNFVTGILGGLAIILALIGLGTLPLNVGGLVLIAFGALLFGLELTVPSHGLLGVGGLICVALGLSALFTGPVDPFEPAAQVATPAIIVIIVTGAAFLAAIVFGAISSRRIGRFLPGGAHAAIGSLGEVRSPLSPVGSVLAAGEEWSARSADGRPLERGTHVRVTKVEGLTLTVEPEASSSERT